MKQPAIQYMKSTRGVSSRAQSRMTEKLRQLLQNKNASHQAGDNDKNQNLENSSHKNPVTGLSTTWGAPMALQEFVIAAVRLEPERECIADSGNDADHFVDQDVQRHPGKQDLRQTAARCINQG